MFPFTHIWFSNKVLGYSNKATVLGAIFPDAFVSKELDYNATHKIGWDIVGFFYREKPHLIDFVKSSLTHTVIPKGLDYYGDEAFEGSKGYCFIKGEGIVEEVIEACNIPEKLGLWKAHNFIEMAIEIKIISEMTYLLEWLDEALHDELIMHDIEATLEDYYELECNSLKGNFKKFQHFVYKEDISNRTLLKNYDYYMKIRHGINIDIDKASAVIDKAKKIVDKDYNKFFAITEKKVKQMLKDGLENK